MEKQKTNKTKSLKSKTGKPTGKIGIDGVSLSGAVKKSSPARAEKLAVKGPSPSKSGGSKSATSAARDSSRGTSSSAQLSLSAGTEHVVTTLSTEQLHKFKRILLEERQRLINIVTGRKPDDLKVDTDDLSDDTDHAVSEIHHNLTVSLRDRERLAIVGIDQALQRIENKSFGMCDSCEETIELRRLEARPVTTQCFTCKEADERKRKIFA